MAQPELHFGASPQLVMVPTERSRGRGFAIFAFVLTLVGFFIPTGLVAVLGLFLSLYALGRSGSGFAVMGVLLGLLGTVVWLIIDLATIVMMLIGGVGALGVVTFGFVMTQPETVELTSDMVNIAIVADEQRDGSDALPVLSDLALADIVQVDPWGTAYRLVAIDEEPRLDVISAGADRAFETDDDVRLTTLKSTWQAAFASFGSDAESFFERLEDFQRRHDHRAHVSCDGDAVVIEVRTPETIADAYEREARGAAKRGEGGEFTIPAPAAPEAPDEPEASADEAGAPRGSGPV